MVFVFMLIRRGKLREEYAIIWFGASLALIGVSLWRDSLDIVAQLAGIYYAPSVLLLGVIVLGFALAMHYSLSLSTAGRTKQAAGAGSRLIAASDGVVARYGGTTRSTANHGSPMMRHVFLLRSPWR